MNFRVSIKVLIASTLLSVSALSSAIDFVHPGVLDSKKQFKFVKENLNKEPWKSAYEKILQDPRASVDYKATPWSTVECGASNDPLNHGCTDEVRDAQAAYTQAILWMLTDNEVYAKNSIGIINAWANTLTGGHLNSNAPLQAAWSAELFTRAAEIMKYTYTGWSQTEKDKVTIMFKQQYLPDIKKMFSGSYACYNHNWHASGIEGMLNIAVFNKDVDLFNDSLSKWRSLLPAYVYVESDGNRPKNTSWCSRNDAQIKPFWNNPVKYVDGLTQESCRDFEHTAYGLAALINAAETAHIQGVDLYNDQPTKASERLKKAMELHSKYQNNTSTNLPKLCEAYDGIKLTTKGTFEIGYNQYAVRENNKLPETQLFLDRTRPTVGYFHYIWETMTHGLIGNSN